jgi:hypothetical protein
MIFMHDNYSMLIINLFNKVLRNNIEIYIIILSIILHNIAIIIGIKISRMNTQATKRNTIMSNNFQYNICVN